MPVYKLTRLPSNTFPSSSSPPSSLILFILPGLNSIHDETMLEWIMQLFSLMASMLGLFQTNSTSTPVANRGCFHNVNSSFSPDCSPWPRPDPKVRLRHSDDNAVRIFGFPPERLAAGVPCSLPNMGNNGYPLLYLRGEVRPYLEYVMGKNWREQLRSDHKTNEQHTYHDGKVVLRPEAPKADETAESEVMGNERAHCVRMLRCGARGIRSEVDANNLDTIGWERPPKQMFGWPSQGGVWVLRHPDSGEGVHVFDGTSADREALREYSRREDQYIEFEQDLSQYEDMDELCRGLEQAGAEFYQNIEDCPEVIELELDESEDENSDF